MIKTSHVKRQTKKYPICNDPAPRNNGLGMENTYQSRIAEIKIEDLLNTEYGLEIFSMFIYDKKKKILFSKNNAVCTLLPSSLQLTV